MILYSNSTLKRVELYLDKVKVSTCADRPHQFILDSLCCKAIIYSVAIFTYVLRPPCILMNLKYNKANKRQKAFSEKVESSTFMNNKDVHCDAT